MVDCIILSTYIIFNTCSNAFGGLAFFKSATKHAVLKTVAVH